MFFGNNQISIQSPILKDKDNNNLELFLFFDPIEAIKSVPKTAETVPIRIAASHADFWRQKNISETIFDYDWTYSPQSYHGKCKIKTNFSESELAACFGESDGLEIDFNRLKQQDPILFFDDNILYEDELGDNGISILSVKIVNNTIYSLNFFNLYLNISLYITTIYLFIYLYITTKYLFIYLIRLESYGVRILCFIKSFLKGRSSNF